MRGTRAAPMNGTCMTGTLCSASASSPFRIDRIASCASSEKRAREARGPVMLLSSLSAFNDVDSAEMRVGKSSEGVDDPSGCGRGCSFSRSSVEGSRSKRNRRIDSNGKRNTFEGVNEIDADGSGWCRWLSCDRSATRKREPKSNSSSDNVWEDVAAEKWSSEDALSYSVLRVGVGAPDSGRRPCIMDDGNELVGVSPPLQSQSSTLSLWDHSRPDWSSASLSLVRGSGGRLFRRASELTSSQESLGLPEGERPSTEDMRDVGIDRLVDPRLRSEGGGVGGSTDEGEGNMRWEATINSRGGATKGKARAGSFGSRERDLTRSGRLR